MKDFSCYLASIFGIVFLCFLIPRATADSIVCNLQSVNYCYSKLENSSYLRQAIPFASDPELAQFCKRFQAFSQCYAPVQAKCLNVLPLLMVAQLEGDFASHGFQCGEGSADYALSKPCFSKADLQRESQQCVNTLNSQVAKAANETDSIKQTEKLCQAGSIYVGCVNNYVEVICEDEVALNWIKTFNTKSLYPLFSAFVCPGFAPSTLSPQGSADSSTSTIILGVVLGLFCLVIIIVIIFLSCFCVKHKYYQNVPCLNSLVERFRKKPPPYLPPNNVLARNNNHNKYNSTSEYSMSSTGQIDQSYFNEELPDQHNKHSSKQSYLEEYVNTAFQEDLSKNTNISTAFRHKSSEAGGKSCATVLSKDSGASCTSTPSNHFEPPTSNPFTRTLSISNSNLDDLKEQDSIQEYY